MCISSKKGPEAGNQELEGVLEPRGGGGGGRRTLCDRWGWDRRTLCAILAKSEGKCAFGCYKPGTLLDTWPSKIEN